MQEMKPPADRSEAAAAREFDSCLEELKDASVPELRRIAEEWEEMTVTARLANALSPSAPDKEIRSAAAKMLLARSLPDWGAGLPHR